jgi:hypothetical protein
MFDVEAHFREIVGRGFDTTPVKGKKKSTPKESVLNKLDADMKEKKVVHESFNLVNCFSAHPDPNRLSMMRWKNGTISKRRAVYLLVLSGKVIKVGQSINYFRRMNDYRYRIGYSCKNLTPELNKMIREAGEDILIFVRYYDDDEYREDEWGEKVLHSACLSSAENKWQEVYSDTLKFA